MSSGCNMCVSQNALKKKNNTLQTKSKLIRIHPSLQRNRDTNSMYSIERINRAVARTGMRGLGIASKESILAKMNVSQPGDKDKKEADRVANKVMRISQEEKKKEEQPVQTKSITESINPFMQREGGEEEKEYERSMVNTPCKECSDYKRFPEGRESDVDEPILYASNNKCPCKSDEHLYQGSGSTWCDSSTGTPQTSVTEHCAGNCVAEHENVHVGDIRACCAKYAQCVSSGATDCATKWRGWISSIRDWTECNAYTREVTCLSNLISRGCGSGGSIPASCCSTLQSELATANTRKGNHCPGTNHPCPF